MEIQNTQNGQTFASVAPVTPVRSEKTDASSLESSSEQQRSEQIQNENVVVEKDTAGVAANSENLSQASRQPADKENIKLGGKQLKEAVEQVESFLKVQNRDLAFTVDEDTDRSVVTVIDSKSGDVIRQIPSEDLLKLAERIQELQEDVGNSVGVFINNQV